MRLVSSVFFWFTCCVAGYAIAIAVFGVATNLDAWVEASLTANLLVIVSGCLLGILTGFISRRLRKAPTPAHKPKPMSIFGLIGTAVMFMVVWFVLSFVVLAAGMIFSVPNDGHIPGTPFSLILPMTTIASILITRRSVIRREEESTSESTHPD